MSGGTFVPSRHGDVIVSLCEIYSCELNPALRLDVAVARSEFLFNDTYCTNSHLTLLALVRTCVIARTDTNVHTVTSKLTALRSSIES